MSSQDTPRFPPQGTHDGPDGLPPPQVPVRTASAPPMEHLLDPNRPTFVPYKGGGQGYIPSQGYAPPAGVFTPGQPFVSARSAAHQQPPAERMHGGYANHHMGNVAPPMSSPGPQGRGMGRGMPRNPNNVRPFVPQHMQSPGAIPPAYVPRGMQQGGYYQGPGGYNMQPMPGQPMYPPMNQYPPPNMQPPHLAMGMPGGVPMHVMPGQQIPPPVQRPAPVVRERKALVIIDPKTNKPINECKALAADEGAAADKPRSLSDAPRPTSTLRASSPAFVFGGATTAPPPPPPTTPASPVKKAKSPPPTPIAVPASPKKAAPVTPATAPVTPIKAPVTPKPVTPKPATPKSVNPKPVTPKAASPKPATPKPVTPKATTPKAVTPKATAPVVVAPPPQASPKKPMPVAAPASPKVTSPKKAVPPTEAVAKVPTSPKKVPEASIMFGTVAVVAEDVSVVSPKAVSRPPGFAANDDEDAEESETPKAPFRRSEPRPANTAASTAGKRCYSLEFLFSFREEYVELPAAAKDPSSGWMSMEVSSDGPNKARRQTSGGRGLERSSSRGDKGKWSRDQSVPGGRGGRGGRGRGGRGAGSSSAFDDVPLKRREDRWVPKKATNNMEAVCKQVQSIMNKMTNQKFERLASQLSDINMDSSAMVEAVIKIIFDKALGEPHFCDMYANLCVYLEQKWKVWSYLQIVQHDDERKWYWTTMSDNDAEVVGPFGSIDEVLESAAEDPLDVVAAPEGLALQSVRVRGGKFIKVWGTDAELYWSGENVADLDATQVLNGPFESFEHANVHAIKTTSFKRILLNSCQEEFEKNNIYEALEAGMEKARAEGSLTPEVEADYEEKKMLTKRRMLGNIRFIGELYKKGMLQERIMHECVAKMLNVTRAPGEDGRPFRLVPVHPTQPPDEESIESLSKLLTTMGKNLEASSGPIVMSIYFEFLGKLTKDKRLSSRITFMLMDVIDLRNNKWQPRRKELTQKTLDEIRKDVEKEHASKAAGAQRTGGASRGLPPSQSSRDRDNSRGGSFRGNPPPQRSSSFAVDRSRAQNFDATRSGGPQGRPASFGKGRPAKAPVKEKKKAPAVKAQLEALDEDVVATLGKKAKAILDEFVGLQDVAEAAACLQELKTAQAAVAPLLVSAAFAKQALVGALEEKQATRDGYFDAVAALLEQKALEPEAVQFGLETAVLLAPDLVCDVPKIGDHLAAIIARLMPLAPVLSLEWLTGLLAAPDADADVLEELVEGGVLADVVGLVLARLPPAVATKQAATTFRALNVTTILPSHARKTAHVVDWINKHEIAAVLPAFATAYELLQVVQSGKDTPEIIAYVESSIANDMRKDALFAKQACLFLADLAPKPSGKLCQLMMGLCGNLEGQAAFVGGLAQATPPEELKALLKHLMDYHVFANDALRAWSDSAAQRACVKGAALAQMDEIVARLRK
ncbi:eukaryotic translation initiation factor 4 gamma [Achlya hypogyna]|uniref:Eukaryotic translation initiation factor 4 gamma n=1 Tax=Achlya hypogyna TaxID=1202772 RepID=A0A1V9YEM4_ACHHY|nr:eukaryotic translation initiation factor 4 gamma [Achlya hypogyna]